MRGSSRNYYIVYEKDNALIVDNSVLRLDSCARDSVSFISSAYSGVSVKPNSRIIGTPQILKALSQRGSVALNPLVCEYQHHFFLGKLRLNIFAAGGVVGNSMLHITSDDLTLLYAPHVLWTSEDPLMLPKAAHLIVRADYPLSVPDSFSYETGVDAIVQCIRKNTVPVVVCTDDVVVGAQLAVSLARLGYAVVAGHRMRQALQDDMRARLSQSVRENSQPVEVRFVRRGLNPSLKKGQNALFVTSSYTKGRASLQEDANTFFLNRNLLPHEIPLLAKSVGAKQISFLGFYAKQYREGIKLSGVTKQVLTQYIGRLF